MTKPDFGMWRMEGYSGNTDSTEIKQAYDVYKSYRADIIDAALMVEHQLDAVLCDCFFNHDDFNKNQFKSMVLHAEFCTFFQKWKLLRSCINEQTRWFDIINFDKSKSKIRELKNIISYRNMFAHGDIVVKSSDHSCNIYFNEGGKKKSEIDEQYIKEVLKEFKAVFTWLEALHISFATSNEKF